MRLKDTILPLIMLTALIGMIVMTFNIPVGIGTKRLGAIVFGTILAFGVLNLVLVFIDSRNNRGN